MPQFKNLIEEVDILREVAIEVKRHGISASHATVGFGAFRGLQSLGMDAREIGQLVALFHQLSPEDTETSKFVLSVQTLQKVQDRAGKRPEELADWVDELERSAGELEHK